MAKKSKTSVAFARLGRKTRLSIILSFMKAANRKTLRRSGVELLLQEHPSGEIRLCFRREGGEATPIFRAVPVSADGTAEIVAAIDSLRFVFGSR